MVLLFLVMVVAIVMLYGGLDAGGGDNCGGGLDRHSHGGATIVAKKWEPRNPVPSRFSGQIRKVEARLVKLAKIRKVETN